MFTDYEHGIFVTLDDVEVLAPAAGPWGMMPEYNGKLPFTFGDPEWLTSHEGPVETALVRLTSGTRTDVVCSDTVCSDYAHIGSVTWASTHWIGMGVST